MQEERRPCIAFCKAGGGVGMGQGFSQYPEQARDEADRQRTLDNRAIAASRSALERQRRGAIPSQANSLSIDVHNLLSAEGAIQFMNRAFSPLGMMRTGIPRPLAWAGIGRAFGPEENGPHDLVRAYESCRRGGSILIVSRRLRPCIVGRGVKYRGVPISTSRAFCGGARGWPGRCRGYRRPLAATGRTQGCGGCDVPR